MTRINNYDYDLHMYYDYNGMVVSEKIIKGKHKEYTLIELDFSNYKGALYSDMFISQPIGLYNAIVSMTLSKHKLSMLPNGKKLTNIDLNEVVSDAYTRLMELGPETQIQVDDNASKYIYTIVAQVYEVYNYQARRALLTQSDIFTTVKSKGYEINTIDGMDKLAIQKQEREKAQRERKALDYSINEYILQIVKYISQARTYESMKEIIYSYANGVALTTAQRMQLVRQRKKIKKMMSDRNIDHPKELLHQIIDELTETKESA